MEDFEKNLRDKFKDAASNEGVDANDLWNSIAPEIAEDYTVTPPTQSSSKGIKKLLPLLLLLLIAIGGLFFFQNENSSTSTNQKTSSNDNTVTTKAIDKNHTENSQKNTIEKTEINKAYQNNKAAKQTSGTETIISNSELIVNTKGSAVSNYDIVDHSNESKNSNTEINSSSNQSLVDNTSNNSNESKLTEDKFESQIIEINANRNTLPNISTNYNNTQSITNEISNSALSTKSSNTSNNITETSNSNVVDKDGVINAFDQLSSIAIEYPLVAPNENPPSFKPREIKFDKSKAKFSLGVYGGSHFLGEKFASDQAPDIARAEELNQGFKLFPGQHFGAEFYFHFNDHLFASAGVSFRRTISQFNKVIETKDSILIRIDDFAGQTITADATRTIIHHNKLSTISFPISVGYQTNFGKWGFGTSAGIMFNMTQKYSGRTISDRNQIITYPDNEIYFSPTKDIYLSYHLNPFLNYSMNDKLIIQLRTEFGIHQFGKTEIYDLKHSGWSTGIGLGLIYTP